MGELFKKFKPYWPYFWGFIGGAIMPFAFSPYDIGVASIASCILLLWSLKNQKPRQAFLIGGAFGLGMFGVGTHWVYVSIHQYGNAAPWLASLITGLFILALALYPAFMSALLNRYFIRNNITRTLLAFPALWVAFEIFRGWFLTGFPWLFVGYSQSATHLRSFGALGSVWAISWVTVLIASILFSIITYYYEHQQNKKYRNGLILGFIAVWGIAFGLNKITWVTPTTNQLQVALIQGNVPQLMRWDPKAVTRILETYQLLTPSALNNQLIIWPEGAIPLPLPHSAQFFKQMDVVTNMYHAGLIAGVPTELNNGQQYYNSLIGVGSASGVYHKSHLVPFGEYVPLESMLRGLIDFFNLPMSSFISGESNQKPLNIQNYMIAPAICYEIAYPIFVRNMSEHADFIVTVSNDAWFGSSIGPWQHLQIAQFRALETGKYVLRATNTGLTAIINPQGKIQNIAPQFEQAVLTGTITQMAGQTPWSRFGVWPLLAALAGVLGLACLFKKREKD